MDRKHQLSAREIDKLIAEKVMCYTIESTGPHLYVRGTDRFVQPLVAYSTDIAAAWQVIEKMDKGFAFSLYSPDTYLEDEERKWEARFISRANRIVYYKEASTALIAICLAALEAVGVEIEVKE